MLSGIGQPEAETPGGLDCFDTTQAGSIAEFFHKSWVMVSCKTYKTNIPVGNPFNITNNVVAYTVFFIFEYER